MDNIFALVDCNNFYVSCERVFNPKLEGKPVVVLSNNDGVIISRSNEVKKLGVKMATPVFKVKDIIESHNVHVFSSNFVLYGDMSQRVMQTLSEFSSEIEIYSIDEAFLSFKGMEHIDFRDYSREIRDKVKKHTGIPVSIGVATTKTLAKVANEIAKKDPACNGILDISAFSEKEIDKLLSRLPVDDVWGVGRRLAPMLRVYGIKTARDLKYALDSWVKKCMAITGLRTVHELRGISCIELEEAVPPQKSIASTRSFGRAVESLSELKQAVAMYCTIATEKLREGNQVVATLQVFIHTNRFKKNESSYSNSAATKLFQPTSNTSVITKAAHKLLISIYKKGYKYKKAGVILTSLMPADQIQLDLFRSYKEDLKSKRLMKAMDKINKKWGRNTCSLAALGITKPWKMRQKKKSRRFTTAWNELIVAKN